MAMIDGTPDSDTVNGTTDDDVLSGFEGDDTLLGREGNDSLLGGDGNDSLDGGAGDDTLLGESANDTLLGGDGNDSLDGGNGNDRLDGGAGDDRILDGPGTDTLTGGGGVNTLDMSPGGGNLGVNLLISSQIDGFAEATILTDPESFANVLGGVGSDQIVGNALANMLDGGGGNDTLSGMGGGDALIGGIGNDSLDGGEGNDSLAGGAGNDTLLGGNGADTLDGGDGNDSVNGGLGDDLLIGGRGANTFDDTGGNDTVSYEGSTTQISRNAQGEVVHDGAATDTVSAAIEQLSGSFFGDLLQGSIGNDRFFANYGNDTVLAADGDDLVDGGAGNDSLSGEAGNDTLQGGAGNDLLMGGAGDNRFDDSAGMDTVFFDVADPVTVNPDYTVSRSGALAGTDTIGAGIEVIQLSGFGDFFNGGARNDSVLGGNGNDTLAGGAGDDTLVGEAGNDILEAGSGSHALLIGGAGSDLLNASTTLVATASYGTSPAGIVVDATANTVQDGFGGNDTTVGVNSFIGSPGDDTMTAGDALDRLVAFHGGGGSDSFVGGGFGASSSGLVRVRYDLGDEAVTINLEGGAAFHGVDLDVLTQIHDVVGSRFADLISDSADPDRIDAAAGDDSIGATGGGNDTIFAGAGNDTVLVGLAGRDLQLDLGSEDDTLTILPAVGAPPPQGVGAAVLTRWQAVDATTLETSQELESDVLGTATVAKSGGTLRLELDPFPQSFDAAAYQGDLILVPGGSFAGTLGGGDDTVIGGTSEDSLDGGGGINTLDFSQEGEGRQITFAADGSANVGAGAHYAGFRLVVGTAFDDVFTAPAFDSTAAIGLARILAVVGDGMDPDLPSVEGGGGGDSYAGLLLADYSALGGPIVLEPGQQAGVSIVDTGSGNDTLTSVFGIILPDAGNQVDFGTRNAFIQVTGGSNSITGGAGSVLSYLDTAGFTYVDLLHGQVERGGGFDTIDGIDNVITGAGDDTILGNEADNLIAPGLGDNVVDGGDGTDTLVVGSRSQDVAGLAYFRAGERLLLATLADEAATTQSASHIEAINFAGETVPVGDLARELPDFAAMTALDDDHSSIVALPRNDSITGSTGPDIIIDQGGANRVEAGDGDDLIVMIGDAAAAAALPPEVTALPPVAGDDELAGGDGHDTVLAGAGADLVDGGAGGDLVLGEDGADSIGGDAGDDVLFGGAGNDFLAGEAGNDTLFGDSGQDILVGGSGSDRLYADGGDLAVFGGSELDTLVIQGGTNGLSVIDLSDPDDQNQSGTGPTITGIEQVDATFAAAAVSVRGGMFGGNGSTIYGGGFNDTIAGSNGSDVLYGNGGDDLIDGGDGRDALYLGAGNDTIAGGIGTDDFFYGGGAAGSGIARVTDFLPGTDFLHLSDSVVSDADEALSRLAMTGEGAILLVNPGAGILFVGVAATSFSADDFLVVNSL